MWMKLVQYWIRRELSSFSLFGWHLVGTSSFKDDMTFHFGQPTLPIKADDEDLSDTTYDDDDDGDVNDNVTMNVRLMLRIRSPQSNTLLDYPGDPDPSGIAFHRPDIILDLASNQCEQLDCTTLITQTLITPDIGHTRH